MARKNSKLVPNPPAYRKLRGYAFDPITSLDLDMAEINQIVYKVPWEENLQPGPEGDYIKVIDRDPPSDAVYVPVDLNEPAILASEGLDPNETNPQFHQQLVYAVIMTTIRNFEKALGRKVMWSNLVSYKDNRRQDVFVKQLAVYPHALREQNAFYSPERKALLFGYYNATPTESSLFLPGGIVYTCLSHDIIAHETTHAILDGVYNLYMETTHPDIAGFHEGFADIVATLQHFFLHPDIVKHTIRKVNGRLDAENILGKLAVEFGKSTGDTHSLRDALGGADANGEWKPAKPKPSDYEEFLECHARGGLLMSAVFDAFITIYKTRTADLVRIETGGTGMVTAGDMNPDFVKRLADEASKAASHVLNMCVRALDYCPPIDMNYGDYLRALITADRELVSSDDHNYRLAFINAFRKRGIFPEGVPNLSVDTLWYNPSDNMEDKSGITRKIAEFLRGFKGSVAYQTDRQKIFEETQKFIRGGVDDAGNEIEGLHSYIFRHITSGPDADKSIVQFENLTGLVFSEQYKNFGIRTSKANKKGPAIEIHSLRINNRIGPDDTLLNQIIITLVQRCKVSVTEDKNGNKVFTRVRPDSKADVKGDIMTFRGGCTLIFDLDDLTLRHAIRKPIFEMKDLGKGVNRKLKFNEKRLLMQYRCEQGDLYDKISFAPPGHNKTEPFAFIHQSQKIIL